MIIELMVQKRFQFIYDGLVPKYYSKILSLHRKHCKSFHEQVSINLVMKWLVNYLY